jgi:hypothetical protein
MSARKHTFLSRFTSAALALACLTCAAAAQPKPGGPPGPPGAPAQPSPLTPPPSQPEQVGPIISVNFAGGQLRDYVAAVREAAAKVGQGVNIIMPKEAETETVPAISLTSVSVDTALRALSFTFTDNSGPQVATRVISNTSDQTITFAMQYANRRPSLATPPGMMMQGSEPRTSRVYSLRSLIEPPEGLPPDPALIMPVEGVLSALRAAAELETKANAEGGTRADAPPEFLLHKDSQLLICRGTNSQQKLVESVLAELMNSLQPKRIRATETAKNAANAKLQEITMRAELEQAQTMVKRCEDELSAAEIRAQRVNELVKGGQAPVTEVETARAQVMTAQSNVRSAQSNLRAAQERMDVIAAQRKAGVAVGPIPEIGDAVEITYEVKDIAALHKDLYKFCKQAIPGNWDEQGRYAQPKDQPNYGNEHWALAIWKSGTMPMTATPAQHRLIVDYLNTIRRAKAGEPNLPGLDADQLIKGAAGKKE